MDIIHHLHSCPLQAQQSVVALGNFDGMHKGHQYVISKAKEIASAKKKPLAVLTFEPHPLSLFTPHLAPFRLTSLEQKANIMASLGVQYLFVASFTSEFAALSPQQFAEHVLVQQLRVCHVFTGYDFIFGHNRTGNATTLQALANHYHFGFNTIDPVTCPGSGEVYSSTYIRQLLRTGKVAEVPGTLGRYFSIGGTVTAGNKKGRMLGFPTANLSLSDYIHPQYGVYASIVTVDQQRYFSVSNIGRKPTLQISSPLLETHLFGFDQDLYGRYIEVELVDFLRQEKRFDSANDLSSQITKDCLTAKQRLGLL